MLYIVSRDKNKKSECGLLLFLWNGFLDWTHHNKFQLNPSINSLTELFAGFIVYQVCS